MNQTISVIVPVYNVAAYLPQCLDSILSQDYEDLEIILIDDGCFQSVRKMQRIIIFQCFRRFLLLILLIMKFIIQHAHYHIVIIEIILIDNR